MNGADYDDLHKVSRRSLKLSAGSPESALTQPSLYDNSSGNTSSCSLYCNWYKLK